MSNPLRTRSWLQQLVGAGVEPVHLFAPGPAGVGDDERVPLVGLRLAGVQVGRSAHHQPRHIGHRHLPALGRRPGRAGRSSRAGRSPSPTVPCSPARSNKRLERGLVVDHAAGEDPLAVVIEDLGEMLFFADIEPDPHVHLLRRGQPLLAPSIVSGLDLSGKAVHGALAVIHLTNQRSSRMSPSEVHAPTVPAATPPRPSTAAGGNEPYRHRRTSQTQIMLARA